MLTIGVVCRSPFTTITIVMVVNRLRHAQVRVLWLRVMLHFVAVGIVRLLWRAWVLRSGVNLIYLCLVEHTFYRWCWRKVLGDHRWKPPPLHPMLLLLEFARRPTPQAEAAKANYNSNVLCSKALSSEAEGEAGERFIVEV